MKIEIKKQQQQNRAHNAIMEICHNALKNHEFTSENT